MKVMVAACALGLAIAGFAQDQHSGMDHAAHMKAMEARGEKAMGFSQTATTHHFVLQKDGGYVQATANDKSDAKSIEQIRAHLFDIQKRFAEGDFSAPELTHGRMPPGVDTLQSLKSDIRYNVKLIDQGGRLYLSSKNAQAVVAIHEFLKFQIEDHGTGDPTAVQK